MRTIHIFIILSLMSSCCAEGGFPPLGIDDCTAEEGPCCEEHGNVPGKPDTCSISEEPYCIGCDGDPVLCWTVGCSSPCNPSTMTCAEDCCLDDNGKTVPCEE